MKFGLSLNLGSIQLLGVSIPPTPEVITATVTPAMSALYAGQSVDDVTNYATMISAGNFASTAGTISSAVVSFQGDAVTATGALSEADTAGFTVTVTDSEGNVEPFVAAPITVEYKARIVSTAGNEADVEINPLVDNSETLNLTIGSGPYADTYTPTAGDLRATAPYNWGGSGLPSLSGTTGLGDTQTLDYGLWSILSGTLSFTSQMQSDGVDISGATAATFDITASEQGTDLTCEVTGSDGTNTTIAETAATAIPGGGGGGSQLVATNILSAYSIAQGDPLTIAYDFEATAAAGDLLLVCVATSDNQTNYEHESVTLDGASATLLVENGTPPTATEKSLASIWAIAAAADGSRSGNLVVELSEPANRGDKVVVLKVPGGSATAFATVSGEGAGGSFDAISTTINTAANGLLVGAIAYEDTDGNPAATYGGFTSPTLDTDGDSGSTPTHTLDVIFAQTGAVTGQTVTIDRSSARSIGYALAAIEGI